MYSVPATTPPLPPNVGTPRPGYYYPLAVPPFHQHFQSPISHSLNTTSELEYVNPDTSATYTRTLCPLVAPPTTFSNLSKPVPNRSSLCLRHKSTFGSDLKASDTVSKHTRSQIHTNISLTPVAREGGLQKLKIHIVTRTRTITSAHQSPVLGLG